MSKRNCLQADYSYRKVLGSKVVEPRVGLLKLGPTIRIAIGVHPSYAKQLKAEGKPIPDAVMGDALIDTGASATAIDVSVAEKLKLPHTGKVESFGIGGLAVGYTSACTIGIPSLKLNVGVPRARCHNITEHVKYIIALIGRDILCHMGFEYDGLKGTVRLVVPLPEGKTIVKGKTKSEKRPKLRRKRKHR